MDIAALQLFLNLSIFHRLFKHIECFETFAQKCYAVHEFDGNHL
jgi:hypothetical protein